MQPPSTDKLILPSWQKTTKPSAMENLIAYGSKPGFISFALGLPAIEYFPTQLYQQAVNEVIETEVGAFQYTPPIEDLKSEIVKLMELRGLKCNEKQVLLTTGAQQGISLLTRLLLENNGQVILEELAYPGVLQAIEPFTPQILAVSTHPNTGINTDEIFSILKNGNKPAFIYLVADGSNPLGYNLEISKRIHLAELSNHYGIPIIEDDPYGFLNYENRLLPIKYYGGDNVFYIGSFSKLFAPSLRVGWIVADECFISKLSSIKESYDINTATFAQRTINAMLRKNIFDKHSNMLRAEYLKKRDNLIYSVKKYLPSQIKFYTPKNGIFMWLELPENINTMSLLNLSLKTKNVAFVPSECFSSTDKIKKSNGMRINFSHPSSEEIEEGTRRLGELINNYFKY